MILCTKEKSVFSLKELSLYTYMYLINKNHKSKKQLL